MERLTTELALALLNTGQEAEAVCLRSQFTADMGQALYLGGPTAYLRDLAAWELLPHTSYPMHTLTASVPPGQENRHYRHLNERGLRLLLECNEFVLRNQD